MVEYSRKDTQNLILSEGPQEAGYEFKRLKRQQCISGGTSSSAGCFAHVISHFLFSWRHVDIDGYNSKWTT